MRFLENASRFSQRRRRDRTDASTKKRGGGGGGGGIISKGRGLFFSVDSSVLPKIAPKFPLFSLFFPKRKSLVVVTFSLLCPRVFLLPPKRRRDTVQARAHTHTHTHTQQQQQQPTPCGTRRLLLVSSVSFPGVSISLSLCLSVSWRRSIKFFVLVNHLSQPYLCGLQKLALTVFIARARRVVALLSHARTTTQ